MLMSDKCLQVVAEAANGSEALAHIQELQPDIAILDINMPGQTGLDVARTSQSSDLSTRLMFLMMHGDEAIFNAAFDLGAQGFLLKESAAEQLFIRPRPVEHHREISAPNGT